MAASSHDGAASGPKPRAPAEPIDRWLPYRRPRPAARTSLFCFPYAGGGASIFRGWAEELPADVELLAVQLPGREARIEEAPVADLARLVPLIVSGLRPHLGRPFALFGHSMGAVVAFELARALRREGLPAPIHLFASGCPAPHIPDLDGTHLLPDDGVIAALRAIGGMSEEVLANRELMELVLPVFRADAAITETYAHADELPLACPITAYAGLSDPKGTREELLAWQGHTSGPFALEVFPGDHFFLKSARTPLIASISRALRATVAR